jgi:hypothetical protein
MAVAKAPGGAYNPLLIVGPPGSGKTHLLQAVGNHSLAANPESRIVLTSAEDFCRQFEAAAAGHRLEELREGYRRASLLLLDDLHLMAGRVGSQGELIRVLKALTAARVQVVLTSDHMPRDLRGINASLLSRIAAGLVVDIQPLDDPSREAVIRGRAAREGVQLPHDVIGFLVGLGGATARDIEGPLNRLLAYAKLMGAPLTVQVAQEVIGSPRPGPASPPAEATPSPATVPSRADLQEQSLRPGRTYLVEEERPEEVYRLLLLAAEPGTLFVLSRSNPQRLRERWGLAPEGLHWLTDDPPPGQVAVGSSLERIMHIFETFLEGQGHGTLLIDGIEYLIGNNSFDAVLRFLRRLIDAIAPTQKILLVALDPRTLDSKEVSILEREMEVLRPGRKQLSDAVTIPQELIG